MRRQFIKTLAVLGGLPAAAARRSEDQIQPSAQASASAARPALARGVNLAHWFEYDRSKPVPSAELVALRNAGFDHVRIPVDPVVLGWHPARSHNRPAFAELRSAVLQAREARLDVVVDLHLVDETKQLIEQSRELEGALVQLWRELASHLADLPPAHVAFELYNEPQYYGARGLLWPPLQRRLLAAVREQAKEHLVLLSGHKGGSFAGLAELPLEEDPFVAYTVHFYEPFFFTHQGIEWLDAQHTAAGAFTQTRYPASMAAMAAPRRVRAHPKAEQELAQYLREDWGLERIEAALRPVAKWARRHQARVLCTEFGVIRAHCDAFSRARWLHDVSRALSANGIGWTVWDYAHHFAITQPAAPGQPRRLDASALKALGLGGRG